MDTFFVLNQPMKKLYRMVLVPVEEKYDLNDTEIDILLFLANNPEYDTARSIVEVRQLAKSHVSVSLRTLIDKGYLASEEDAKDRRLVHLHITTSAKPIIRAGQKQQKKFRQILFQNISEEELKVYSRVADRMYVNALQAIRGDKV